MIRTGNGPDGGQGMRVDKRSGLSYLIGHGWGQEGHPEERANEGRICLEEERSDSGGIGQETTSGEGLGKVQGIRHSSEVYCKGNNGTPSSKRCWGERSYRTIKEGN